MAKTMTELVADLRAKTARVRAKTARIYNPVCYVKTDWERKGERARKRP